MDITHDTPASKVSDEHKAAFVMSFVKQSDKLREDLVDTWEETLANYFVRPYTDSGWRSRTDRPLVVTGRERGRLGYSILKDPESHQVVETLLAKLWTALFGEDGFIASRGIGVEDAHKSDTVNRLLEYDLSIHGHPRSFYEWIKDSLIFGTGILEVSWHYEEGIRRARSVSVDQFSGQEFSSFAAVPSVLHDDPRIKPVNIMDFYPDPGESRLQWMRGCAKRFRVSAKQALRRGDWDRDAVLKAINNNAKEDSEYHEDHDWQDDLKYTEEAEIPDDFQPLMGYEYWGEVPWKTNGDFNDRQVITVLSGEIVNDREWPLNSIQLPFFDCTINPVEGRFHGLGPLEVMRHNQDFADTLKRMIANAVVRGTLAQPIVNSMSGVQAAKLRVFNPDVPIQVQGSTKDAISYLEYRPPIEGAVATYSQTKQQMREESGALGAIQGIGLGSKRFSATEAAETMQQAFDRPEMLASLIERDSLPPIGKHLLALNQQFLETSEDLALRVGERPGSVALADILTDFDVRFVGSRRQHNRQTKLQSLERFAMGVGSNPILAVNIPWDMWEEEYIDALDLQKLRQWIGAPDTIAKNILLMRAMGQQNAQNGNGQPTQPSQAGSPAQDAGGVLGPAR